MKKLWTMLLAVTLLAALTVTGMAQGAVKVSGISDMGIYHQLVALIVEYDQEVAAPDVDTYVVADFASAYMKEEYDRADIGMGKITAVYTNDINDRREDKTSVPGKYVVIELEPVSGSFFSEENGVQTVNNPAGYCTWRLAGEGCEWRRNDFSALVVSQKKNIVNANGDVVAKAGVLPTLQPEDIRHLKIEDFVTTTMKNPQGYDIHYSLSIPKNYDPAKKYPMVVSVSGNGGRINYKQQDAEGNFLCVGGNLGRDSAAAAWLECEEDIIILTPQPWRDQPEEWGIDIVADTIQVIDSVMAEYSVDTERVYAVGSSFGTMHLSSVIMRRPELFAAYAQCNGAWMLDKNGAGTPESGSVNIYTDEFAGKVTGWNCTDALSLPEKEDCIKAKDEYWTEATAALQGVVDNRMKVYFWHGVNDESISWTAALSPYAVLRAMYEEAGLTQDEIDDLVKLYFADNEEYYETGICEIHATSKLAVSYPWFRDWMLAQ